MNRRADILQALVRFETPPEPLLRELRTFPWDWDGEPLLVLRREHLFRVIGRFLSGELSATQLESWAENLECREDVAFDPADESLLDDVFFRLANPFINEPLTKDMVARMRAELAAAPRA